MDYLILRMVAAPVLQYKFLYIQIFYMSSILTGEFLGVVAPAKGGTIGKKSNRE
jgi:hypothetical protein